MRIVRRRLASRSEYFQLFLICVFPVHVWAIANIFYSIPTLLLQMNAIQLVSVIAYVFVFALFESLIVFGLLFLISLIMPPRLSDTQLLPVGTLIILLASISVVLIHLYEVWEFESIKFGQWAALWVGLGLAGIALTIIWMKGNQRVESVIRSAVERVALLSLVYVSLDGLGLFVILIRNLI